MIMTTGSALEAARAYLSPRGASVTDLAEAVRPIEPGEFLLLAGSVPEGLANDDSDVDLVLLGAPSDLSGIALREAVDVETNNFRHESGIEISVERFSPEYGEMLAGRVRELIGAITDPDAMGTVDLIDAEVDRRFLHRVRHGVPLAGEEALEEWRERLVSRRLPEVMAGLHLMKHFTQREDAFSHFDDGDLQSASWVFAQSVAEMAAASLASVGETHYNPRWWVRLLDRHSAALGDRTADRYVDLLLSPARTVEGIEEATRFLDEQLGVIIERLPSLAGAYARITLEFPLRTQI
jgi:hypothetical protein